MRAPRRRQRAAALDDEDDDGRDVRRLRPGWHVYREGGRTYYYRTGPGEEQRIYRRVYRYYRRYGGW